MRQRVAGHRLVLVGSSSDLPRAISFSRAAAADRRGPAAAAGAAGSGDSVQAAKKPPAASSTMAVEVVKRRVVMRGVSRNWPICRRVYTGFCRAAGDSTLEVGGRSGRADTMVSTAGRGTRMAREEIATWRESSPAC